MSHTHFHVILPSDSSIQYYPNNTVAKYVTKLSERISLDGEYELGLSEIIYPYSWYNVDNTSSNLWLEIVKLADDPNSYDKPLERYEISSGYYGDGLSFAKNITGAAANIFDWDDCVVQFTFNDSSRKLTMLLRCGPNIMLNMSSEFMTKFGFNKTGPYKTGSYGADSVLDLNNGLNLMYVYCDIAAYTTVGDTKAPLLRVCNVHGMHGQTDRTIFTHPHYVPVGRREFDTIEINISTERGQPMPFQFGKSVVTLHFRRKHSLSIAS